MAQRFPEDFIGAAPEGVDIICLSNDEEEGMCDLSMTSDFGARPSTVIGRRRRNR